MSKATLFLVDDDESLRRVTSYHLEQAGYELAVFESGDAAWAALQESEASGERVDLPDLLVTDVRMPGMDGLELLRRVKESWPALGVIVVTADGNISDAVDAMRAGAHDYLLKPFEHDSLIMSIDKGLRHRRIEPYAVVFYQSSLYIIAGAVEIAHPGGQALDIAMQQAEFAADRPGLFAHPGIAGF